MITWKIPPQNIFWIPVPYDPNQRLDSIKVDTPVFIIKHPETGINTQCKFLDYLGPYLMFPENPDSELAIPNFLSRQCTDKVIITGDILAGFLREKHKAFKDNERVLFYQLTKI